MDACVEWNFSLMHLKLFEQFPKFKLLHCLGGWFDTRSRKVLMIICDEIWYSSQVREKEEREREINLGDFQNDNAHHPDHNTILLFAHFKKFPFMYPVEPSGRSRPRLILNSQFQACYSSSSSSCNEIYRRRWLEIDRYGPRPRLLLFVCLSSLPLKLWNLWSKGDCEIRDTDIVYSKCNFDR